jgi:hypothetical protein
MIQAIARRRFNIVDAAGLTLMQALAASGHWAWAAAVFFVGVITSAMVEAHASRQLHAREFPEPRQ